MVLAVIRRLFLQVAKLLKDDFLQQNGYSSYDRYCPFYKTVGQFYKLSYGNLFWFIFAWQSWYLSVVWLICWAGWYVEEYLRLLRSSKALCRNNCTVRQQDHMERHQVRTHPKDGQSLRFNLISPRESMSQIMYQLSSMKFKDPVKDGEEKIKGDYEELLENMQAAFRNLED